MFLSSSFSTVKCGLCCGTEIFFTQSRNSWLFPFCKRPHSLRLPKSFISFSLNILENTSFLCIATGGGVDSTASESFKIAYNTETEQELNIHFYIRDDILFLSMCFRLRCVRMLRCFSRVSRSYLFPESIISSRMSLEHTLSGAVEASQSFRPGTAIGIQKRKFIKLFPCANFSPSFRVCAGVCIFRRSKLADEERNETPTPNPPTRGFPSKSLFLSCMCF